MYIIVDNKPYAVRNNKAFEVSFGDKGTIVIGEEAKDVKVQGQFYKYEEISRKFNLKALLRAKDEPTKELVDELRQEINSLTKENDELKKQLEELTSTPEDKAEEDEADQADNEIVDDAEDKAEEAKPEAENKDEKKNK